MRKLKIVQRVADKKIMTWTEVLAKKEGFRSGTITIDEDGNTTRLELDQLGSADYLQLPGIPQREKALMAENQALQARLAMYEKGMNTTVGTSVPEPASLDGVIPPLADAGEETPLPQPLDLTDVAPVDEEAIAFAPEPEMKTKSQLGRLTNEKLVVHAHSIDSQVNVPDDAIKRELIEICLDLQKKYKAKTQG